MGQAQIGYSCAPPNGLNPHHNSGSAPRREWELGLKKAEYGRHSHLFNIHPSLPSYYQNPDFVQFCDSVLAKSYHFRCPVASSSHMTRLANEL